MAFHVQIDLQSAFPKLGGHKSQFVLHHGIKNNGNETKQLKWSDVHNQEDGSTEYDWLELYIHPICFYKEQQKTSVYREKSIPMIALWCPAFSNHGWLYHDWNTTPYYSYYGPQGHPYDCLPTGSMYVYI